MGSVAPVPWQTSVIQLDPQTNKPLPGFTMGKDFGNWLFTSVVNQIATAPSVFPSVSLTAQSASIGTTPIPLPALATGLYRVTYYARITTIDPVSSSVTITILWTDGAVACSLSGAAMTGNTTATVQTATALIAIDASSPISYSTAYVSNTPGTMKYKLLVLVEAV